MFFSQLQIELQNTIRDNYPQLDPTIFFCKLVTPPNPKLGHLAANCFMLAKSLSQTPQQIAQTIAQNFIPTDKNWISKIQSEGAYINLLLDYRKLGKILLDTIYTKQDYGKNDHGAGRKILIEFSSPNTNKPLHLGHARNNSIGFTLAKILENASYDVVKANLINDRGIHICQSMLAYSLFGKAKTPQSEKRKGDHFVGDYYILFHQKKVQDPKLVEQAQEYLQKWEQGDSDIRQLWELMTAWALAGINETYKRCAVEFDKFYFESDTYVLGKQIVKKALTANICQKNKEGAVVINLADEGLGEKVLLRKNGTAVYITQDIFTTIKKYQDYAFDECLFVVGSEQKLHFQTLFAILKKLGFQWVQNCKHLSYGMIFLPDGKMKSREGKIVDLDNLLDEVKNLALQEIQKRKDKDREPKELVFVAEKIAQAALKYFILRTHSKKDFVFDSQNSLSFEGNTGPYLQYTYARIYSLLSKVDFIPPQNTYEWNKEEIQILQSFLLFPHMLKNAALTYEPSLVANFTFELCKNFNKFYYEHNILHSKVHQQKRIYLSSCTKIILEKSFKILGIYPLTRM